MLHKTSSSGKPGPWEEGSYCLQVLNVCFHLPSLLSVIPCASKEMEEPFVCVPGKPHLFQELVLKMLSSVSIDFWDVVMETSALYIWVFEFFFFFNLISSCFQKDWIRSDRFCISVAFHGEPYVPFWQKAVAVPGATLRLGVLSGLSPQGSSARSTEFLTKWTWTNLCKETWSTTELSSV